MNEAVKKMADDFLKEVKKERRYREKYIIPEGAKRPPVKLEWIDYYDCITDALIPNGQPRCPYCKEMPYDMEQCQFCGQRFTTDEEN